MTPQPIPILDGRRAVPGDIVELVTGSAWLTNGKVDPDGPKPGERVRVSGLDFRDGDKYLEIAEYRIDPNDGRTQAFDAAEFVIVPPDTKAETSIAIEAVKNNA